MKLMRLRRGAGMLAVLVALLLLGAGHALASGELTVTLAEKCGTVDNDGVAIANQPCEVTATVTDGSDQPVVGASVYADGTSGVTNGSGQATLMISSSWSTHVDVVADSGTLSGGATLLFVNPGKGAVQVRIKDKNGQFLSNYAFVVGQGTEGHSTGSFDNSPKAGFSGSLTPGTCNVLVSAQAASGDGYMLLVTGVTILEGAAATVVADGTQATPVTVAATLNGTPAKGAWAYLVPLTQPSYSPQRGITTDDNGQAVIRVFPGTYEAAVIGGDPAVFKIQSSVEVAASEMSVSLLLTETAEFRWQPAAAVAPGFGELAVSGGSTIRKYVWPVASGTLLMAPGSYRISGSVEYSTENEEWGYGLRVPDPVDGSELPTYAAGGKYSLTGCGPWTLSIDTVPSSAIVPLKWYFDATFYGPDAEITGYYFNRVNSDYWLLPDVTLRDGHGNPVPKPPGEWEWSLDQPGHYRVTSLAASLGPFFPTGTALFNMEEFDTACGGPCVALSLKNAQAQDGPVIPGGSFDALPKLFFPVGQLPQSVSLNLAYNPDEVTFDAVNSSSGSGTLSESNGVVTWSWSSTADDWTGVVEPQIRFTAKPGFGGTTTIQVLESSAATDQNGSVTLTVPQAAIPVANSAVKATGYVDGPGTDLTVVATDGQKTVTGVYANSRDDYVYNVYLADVPSEASTLMAIAPVQTTAETAATPPSAGTAEADSEMVLLFGDADGDNQVTREDLPYVAAEFTDDLDYATDYASWMDVDWDWDVDIYDLVTAAHNVGQTGSTPTLRGTLTLNVSTPGMTEQTPLLLYVLASSPDGTERVALVRQLTLDADNSSTLTLTGLPPGIYWVGIYDGDDGYRDDAYVQIFADKTSQLNFDW